MPGFFIVSPVKTGLNCGGERTGEGNGLLFVRRVAAQRGALSNLKMDGDSARTEFRLKRCMRWSTKDVPHPQPPEIFVLRGNRGT